MDWSEYDPSQGARVAAAFLGLAALLWALGGRGGAIPTLAAFGALIAVATAVFAVAHRKR